MLSQLANLVLTGESTAPSINWGSIITADSFSGLLSGVSTVLPIVVPVALAIAGIPVIWKLVKRMMRG